METKHTPEVQAAIWLSKQNYQKEQGEQEYMMYFDVDIPKMLAKYSQEHNATHQQTIAELEAWKESEIKITLPLFELMHLHPEMKIGDGCIQKAIQFIKERDELKKQNAELVKRLKELSNCKVSDNNFHLARIKAIQLILTIESTK